MKKFILFILFVFSFLFTIILTNNFYSKASATFSYGEITLESINQELIITINNINASYDVSNLLIQSPVDELLPNNRFECEKTGEGVTWTIDLYDHSNIPVTNFYYNKDLFTYSDIPLSTCNSYYNFNLNIIDFGENPSNFSVNKAVITIPLKVPLYDPFVELTVTDLQNYYTSMNIEYIKVNQDDYSLRWLDAKLVNNYFYFTADLILNEGLVPTYLYIPNSKFNIGNYNNFKSRVDYYDSANTLLCTLDLSTMLVLEGLVNINPYTNENCVSKVESIKKLKLYITQFPYDNKTYGSYSEYVNYFTNAAVYTFNEELYVVNLYNGANRLKQAVYSKNDITGALIPYFTLNQLPKSYREGLIFDKWAYSNGLEYVTTMELVYSGNADYYTFTAINEPNPDYLINNQLNLYATFKFQSINVGDITPNPDEKLDKVLGAFDLNSNLGYLLVYVIIVIIIDISLYLWLKSTLLILIVNFIITGVFTFMGSLNLLTLILIYSLLVVFTMVEIRKE